MDAQQHHKPQASESAKTWIMAMESGVTYIVRIWSRRPGEATSRDAKIQSRMETGRCFNDSGSLRQCWVGKDQGRISHLVLLNSTCRCDVGLEQ